MRRLLLSMAFVIAFIGFAFGQSMMTVEGTVVNQLTGDAVPGSWVNVHAQTNSAGTFSDSSGHFQVTLAGTLPYWVESMRAGFLRGEFSTYGMKQAPTSSQVRVTTMPESVILGKLTDDDGLPVAGLAVSVYRPIDALGRPAVPIGYPVGAKSDDLGEFRLGGLAAGKYYLRVFTHDLALWDTRYTDQYYPGSLLPGGDSIIEVKAGEQHGPVLFHIRKQQGVVLAGRIVAPPGVSADSISSTSVIITAGDSFQGFGARASARRDGAFLFPNVPPGTYMIRVTNGERKTSSTELYGEQQLIVGDTELRALRVPVRAVEPVDITGTVVFAGAAKPMPVIVQVHGQRAQFIAKTDANGVFVIKGARPDRYFISSRPEQSESSEPPRPAPGQTSVRWGDRDVTDTEFHFDGLASWQLRITYAATATITGRLVDAMGRPVAGRLLAFSAAGSASTKHRAKTAEDGSFTISVCPAGAYHVYQASEGTTFLDSDYLKAHENDLPLLHAVEGDNAPIVLKLPAKP